MNWGVLRCQSDHLGSFRFSWLYVPDDLKEHLTRDGNADAELICERGGGGDGDGQHREAV